jgi:RNA polymerase sigma-70 factor (ECF subfamily)
VTLDRSLAEQVFRENERHLFDLAYRLLGSVADADDVVQEAFARVLEKPPPRTDEPLRPWLVRVAVNLARDVHRRRRRRGSYTGPWLPAPLEVATDESDAPDARYGRLESASVAFLRALELLPPKARAVLVLRDVFAYSVKETASALQVSEPDVKTTLHRARRALEGYDRARRPLSPAEQARTREALERFLLALQLEDVGAVEACLAESVRAESDGNGEHVAALNPVIGSSRVARFFVGLKRKTDTAPPRFDARILNGLPAFLFANDDLPPRYAARYVIRGEIDAAGKLTRVEIVLAARKLARLRFPS